MKLSERVSYLKGLMDGMELKDSKQGKVLSLMADILADMVLHLFGAEHPALMHISANQKVKDKAYNWNKI